MDFLSKLKAELSDLKDQLYETFDDCEIAEKDGFVWIWEARRTPTRLRCACRLGGTLEE